MRSDEMARKFEIGDRVRWKAAGRGAEDGMHGPLGTVEGFYVGRRKVKMLAVRMDGYGGGRIPVPASTADLVLENITKGGSDGPGAV